MTLTEIIGYLAAIFGTSIMLPQVFRTMKTRKVDDLSLIMLIIYLINCSLWEVYGILIESTPIIICNIAALIIGCLQTILKIRYNKKVV